ncbi:hypothetical protein QR680_006066 [Steinernema hermaphroditum]|uniref:Uncharacterized protein n=1 Tax=Steinernema hermaphroditum TaxID=289476 RepID=A0AA39LWR9_9BILA|nr:hypothetical protein QR680_006066 [Steinernema hermaphroditum]
MATGEYDFPGVPTFVEFNEKGPVFGTEVLRGPVPLLHERTEMEETVSVGNVSKCPQAPVPLLHERTEMEETAAVDNVPKCPQAPVPLLHARTEMEETAAAQKPIPALRQTQSPSRVTPEPQLVKPPTGTGSTFDRLSQSLKTEAQKPVPLVRQLQPSSRATTESRVSATKTPSPFPIVKPIPAPQLVKPPTRTGSVFDRLSQSSKTKPQKPVPLVRQLQPSSRVTTESRVSATKTPSSNSRTDNVFDRLSKPKMRVSRDSGTPKTEEPSVTRNRSRSSFMMSTAEAVQRAALNSSCYKDMKNARIPGLIGIKAAPVKRVHSKDRVQTSQN